MNQRNPIGRPHERGAEHGQLARAREVEDVQVGGHVHPAEQVREHGKGSRGDSGQSGGQTIEAVGQIDGIAAPGDHHRHEDDEQPGSKVDDQILEERQRRCGRWDRVAGTTGL